ncbi:MAG: ZTL protein [Betaproteobacteria bacterium]|nr:ZTL protein [Betaproteobacteria bacterium]
MSPARPSRIYVLAGVNGAGKSSVGGAAFRSFGADYYNPDEAARELIAAHPGLPQAQANSAAWHQGRKLLERVIAERLDYAFETTLGASMIPRLLWEAADRGIEVYVWYAGLAAPELHLARVRSRVRRGGHDIPGTDIRRRYEHSRLNLVQLLPKLAALRLYDNSAEADPAAGNAPRPVLVLHVERGKILNPQDLARAPDWAKPIIAAAMKLSVR